MLKNFKIGSRLGLAFGLIMALMIIVGGYAIKEIKSLDADIDLLVNDRMVKLEQANTIVDNINLLARVLRNIVIDDNKDHQAEEMRRIAEARKKVGELMAELDRTVKSEKGVALLTRIKGFRTQYIQSTETYMELVRAGQDRKSTRLNSSHT